MHEIAAAQFPVDGEIEQRQSPRFVLARGSKWQEAEDLGAAASPTGVQRTEI